jgi:hypothetical protein
MKKTHDDEFTTIRARITYNEGKEEWFRKKLAPEGIFKPY